VPFTASQVPSARRRSWLGSGIVPSVVSRVQRSRSYRMERDSDHARSAFTDAISARYGLMNKVASTGVRAPGSAGTLTHSLVKDTSEAT
jgi:hypothetical protein